MMWNAPPSHEPSAWLRNALNARINEYLSDRLERCQHPEAEAIATTWTPGRAFCAACWPDHLRQNRDTCDRCGRIGTAFVGESRSASINLLVLFALCGDCLSAEYDWRAYADHG